MQSKFKIALKNLKSTIKLLWLIPITGTFVVIGNKFFGAGCLFQMITGLPCMGCGGTRAFLALIKGDFAEMFFYFPLLPLCIFSVLVYFVIWIFSLTPPTVFIKIGWFLLFSVITQYIIRLIIFFPKDCEPLDYNELSMWGKLIKFLLN